MSIQNTKDESFEEKILDEDTFAEIGDDSSSFSNRLTKLTQKPIDLDKQIEKVPLKVDAEIGPSWGEIKKSNR